MKRRTVRDDGPDPIDYHVGQQLKSRRKAIRMSQTKVGESIGTTFQQVQKYENGKNRIGASNLYKLAHALDVPVSYFFEGLQDGTTDSAVPQRSQGDLELARASYGLSEDNKRTLAKIATVLREPKIVPTALAAAAE